jgi:hypothetical protein
VLDRDAAFVHQSSTSPVVLESTIDDDLNGSIARDRFTLAMPNQHNGKMQKNETHFEVESTGLAVLRFVPVVAVSSVSVPGSVSPPAPIAEPF